MMVHANLDGQVGVDGLAAVNRVAGAQNCVKGSARQMAVTAAELTQNDLDVAPLRVLVRSLSCCIFVAHGLTAERMQIVSITSYVLHHRDYL